MLLLLLFLSTPSSNFEQLVKHLVVRKNSGCKLGFFRSTPCKFNKFDSSTKLTDDFFINGTIYKHQDFTVYLEQVKNDSTALVYLDPPYLQKSNEWYAGKDLGRIFPYLADWMKTCQCKFVLVHSKCAFLDEQLATADGKFRLYKTYDKNYGVSNDKTKITTHYVITNML